MSNQIITGTIKHILNTESGVSKAGKEWQKQEFVIETDDQYPKDVAFTLFGNKLSLIEGIGIGQSVEVSYNLESREYNGRWFHNINAWKIDAIDTQGCEPIKANSVDEPQQEEPKVETKEEEDNLPF